MINFFLGSPLCTVWDCRMALQRGKVQRNVTA